MCGPQELTVPGLLNERVLYEVLRRLDSKSQMLA